MKPPRCFISYSRDNEALQVWVRRLATRLRESGIDAMLDQLHCAPGTDDTKFMERGVRESDFVLLVCTPNFAQKADAGVGGVASEQAIVSREIFAGEFRETKFVPLLREGDVKESLPSYLKRRLFIDFRENAFFENRLEELFRHFCGEPLNPTPPIGPRPPFRTKLPSAVPSQETSLQQKITNSIGMKFVLIPSGAFMMGSRMRAKELVSRFGGEAKWFAWEKPNHSVMIDRPFYLQTTPVTQGQWQRVMENHPSHFKDGGHECPVEQVSWEDARQFIDKLNQIERIKDYRLPSEAEWEYACRAGTETEFFSGNEIKGLDKFSWHSEDSGDKTHPVGKKKPNAWGLYDMHGNVWEWVEDDWHGSYKGAPNNGQAWIDNPRSPERVLRGGGWFSAVRGCRSARRITFPPYLRYFIVGFRLARSVTLGA